MVDVLVPSQESDARTASKRFSSVRKWDKMSREGLDSVMRTRPADFQRLLQRGIPAERRWQIWKNRRLQEDRRGEPLDAACAGFLLESQSAWSVQIDADIERTFPGVPAFTAHQGSLRKVLNAYALLNPQVGYCQGMNFVVGVLLMVSGGSEQESLQIFTRLMEDSGLNGLYQDGFPLLDKYLLLFNQLMEELLPDLKRHFEEEHIAPSDFLPQWFLSLFGYCLPLDAVLVIWDSLMCNGVHSILLAAIALLKVVQQLLLTMHQEEILLFFKSLKAGQGDYSDRKLGCLLMQEAAQLAISAKILSALGLPFAPVGSTTDETNPAEEETYFRKGSSCRLRATRLRDSQGRSK